ncbi:MAG: M18 family aminopeptidase [Lachnospiraceae bacterium]|nr:M18 family aminopeptidase [Lachnospiraceae bacterium]
MSQISSLLKFIDHNPTAFHVVANVKDTLSKAGYAEVKESEDWKLKAGSKAFVTRNSSSLIAFSLPKGKTVKGFRIFSAHTDSPSFRVKENPELEFSEYLRLNVEKYGGMIVSSWLDRPLSIAGRVLFEGAKGIEEKLVNIDRDLLVIPNVAIHMNSDINKGYQYGIQNDIPPLFAQGKKGSFVKLLAKETGIKADKILGSDLFLYPRQKGFVFGAGKEFAASPRFDDQACVYAGMRGLLESEKGTYVNVLALFDNEEVGSGTKQGADSTFLEDTLYRICDALNMSRTDYLKAQSDSFALSADNAHGVHPSMSGKADPVNRPILNKGVVLKFNGNQKYATDASAAAFVRSIAKKANVALQDYANNSDIPGGSTLGNISTAHVSIRTADIGLAQLSMHSACETMGTKDIDGMIALATAFYNM